MEKSKGVPNIVWIAIVILIGYLIISDILKNIEEKRQIMIIENEVKNFTKKMNKTFQQNDKMMNEALNFNKSLLGNMNNLTTTFNNAKNQIEIKPTIRHTYIKKENNKKAKIQFSWTEKE